MAHGTCMVHRKRSLDHRSFSSNYTRLAFAAVLLPLTMLDLMSFALLTTRSLPQPSCMITSSCAQRSSVYSMVPSEFRAQGILLSTLASLGIFTLWSAGMAPFPEPRGLRSRVGCCAHPSPVAIKVRDVLMKIMIFTSGPCPPFSPFDFCLSIYISLQLHIHRYIHNIHIYT